MRVLVTGCAGFVGSHVVEALRAAGHEVRGLDVRESRPGSAGHAVADVRDGAAVERALAGVDAVCHQAALVGTGTDVADLPAFVDVNATGTAVLLAAMARRGVTRLVLASSMVVYGEGGYRCAEHGPVRPAPRAEADLAAGRFEPPCPCGRPLTTTAVEESAPLDPRNAYAASKVAQEHLAATWARETGASAVALRYHNVYGPRMPRDTPYAGVAAIFASALLRGEPPRVFEDGGQLRDFIHVRDVAAANRRALETAAGPGLRAYNIATGAPHTVGEMAGVLAGALGGPEPVVTGEYRLGDVRHVHASPERAITGLGFRARVGFAAGMREFAAAARQPATTGG